MTVKLAITADLAARIDALAARSNLSASDIVRDALENGRSLDWQERFLEKIAAAVEEADRRAFADTREIERVLNKYRPA
ncbi:ribbon-helix-helix protein, CopG family [Rhizobium sp. AG855]|uniref:CopG family ribbon-helix-helix protein n=1 Tax=Rhizobium sp. AG855 TaxID=2183898 RepID=UPI000E71EE65|nr:ribbon-helix-helix protein, CopG family [Rhizobium sp. AG855]RKE83761.1 ribbon-helix-helix CopG family protein [Rhizobium sp. AG855]